jgi:hypothetical protein
MTFGFVVSFAWAVFGYALIGRGSEWWLVGGITIVLGVASNPIALYAVTRATNTHISIPLMAPAYALVQLCMVAILLAALSPSDSLGLH